MAGRGEGGKKKLACRRILKEEMKVVSDWAGCNSNRKEMDHSNTGLAWATGKINMPFAIMGKTGRGNECHIIKFM